MRLRRSVSQEIKGHEGSACKQLRPPMSNKAFEDAHNWSGRAFPIQRGKMTVGVRIAQNPKRNSNRPCWKLIGLADPGAAFNTRVK